jgi:class 3 adenylate cyclase
VWDLLFFGANLAGWLLIFSGDGNERVPVRGSATFAMAPKKSRHSSKQDHPLIGRLPILCGSGRARAIHDALLLINDGRWFVRRQEDLVVFWADIFDSKNRIKDLGDRDFYWLTTHFYNCVRERVLKWGGIIVNLVGDGVLAIFPSAASLPGSRVGRLPSSPEARAVLCGVQLGMRLEKLVEPGGELQQHRELQQREKGQKSRKQVKFVRVAMRIVIVGEDTLVGTFIPSEESEREPLPMDLVALGLGPTVGNTLCKAFDYSTSLKIVRDILRLTAPQPGVHIRRFAEKYQETTKRESLRTLLVVDDKVMRDARRSKMVRTQSVSVAIPEPIPIKPFSERKVWLVAERKTGD